MNKILYSFAILAAMIFCSCSDSDDGYQDLKNTVVFSEKNLTFDVEGSSKPLTIATNKAWTLSCDADWCTFSTTSGNAGETTITVTTDDLPTGTFENRVATLTIHSEGLTSGNTFSIIQTRFPFFKFDGDTIKLDNKAQQFTVKGTYNYGFKIQKSWWISSVTPVEGRAATQDSTFTFKAMLNPSGPRVGKIVISNYAETASATIYVKQEGNFPLTWNTLGSGTFYDDYFTSTGKVYKVTIQQAAEASNYYKVVDPYKNFLSTEGNYLIEAGFDIGTPSSEIILWVNDDETVGFDNFNTGIIHPSYGAFWGYNPALFTSGDPTLCTIKDNLITLVPSMYFPAIGGGFGQANWAKYPIQITLPAAK